MGKYNRKDRYYNKAKADGHVSRAAYKLEQIQQKYKVLKGGDHVVDLGAAPGSWLKILSNLVGKSGKVFGIDLLPLKQGKINNVTFQQGDIYDEQVIDIIKESLGKVDVIVSDMAPSTSGIKFRDCYLSYELGMRALEIADEILENGGNFVVKIFPGEEFADYRKEMQSRFDKVSQYRPPATRDTSIEVYLVGLGYKKG